MLCLAICCPHCLSMKAATGEGIDLEDQVLKKKVMVKKKQIMTVHTPSPGPPVD